MEQTKRPTTPVVALLLLLCLLHPLLTSAVATESSEAKKLTLSTSVLSKLSSKMKMPAPSAVTRARYDRYPLVMIPGLLGSSLEVKSEKAFDKLPMGDSSFKKSGSCPAISKWTKAFDFTNVVGLHGSDAKYCPLFDLTLVQQGDDLFSNRPGVSVRVLDQSDDSFGAVSASDYLLLQEVSVYGQWLLSLEQFDLIRKLPISYFGLLINNLIRKRGYKPMHISNSVVRSDRPDLSLERDLPINDWDLFTASYDWRMPPSAHMGKTKFYKNLKRLIETVSTHHRKPVMIFAHSMGGLQWLAFQKWLGDERESWVSKYVHTVMTFGTPYLGSFQSTVRMLTGVALSGESDMPATRDSMRSWGSAFWLQPIHTRAITRNKPFLYQCIPREVYNNLKKGSPPSPSDKSKKGMGAEFDGADVSDRVIKEMKRQDLDDPGIHLRLCITAGNKDVTSDSLTLRAIPRFFYNELPDFLKKFVVTQDSVDVARGGAREALSKRLAKVVDETMLGDYRLSQLLDIPPAPGVNHICVYGRSKNVFPDSLTCSFDPAKNNWVDCRENFGTGYRSDVPTHTTEELARLLGQQAADDDPDEDADSTPSDPANSASSTPSTSKGASDGWMSGEEEIDDGSDDSGVEDIRFKQTRTSASSRPRHHFRSSSLSSSSSSSPFHSKSFRRTSSHSAATSSAHSATGTGKVDIDWTVDIDDAEEDLPKEQLEAGIGSPLDTEGDGSVSVASAREYCSRHFSKYPLQVYAQRFTCDDKGKRECHSAFLNMEEIADYLMVKSSFLIQESVVLSSTPGTYTYSGSASKGSSFLRMLLPPGRRVQVTLRPNSSGNSLKLSSKWDGPAPPSDGRGGGGLLGSLAHGITTITSRLIFGSSSDQKIEQANCGRYHNPSENFFIVVTNDNLVEDAPYSMEVKISLCAEVDPTAPISRTSTFMQKRAKLPGALFKLE